MRWQVGDLLGRGRVTLEWTSYSRVACPRGHYARGDRQHSDNVYGPTQSGILALDYYAPINCLPHLGRRWGSGRGYEKKIFPEGWGKCHVYQMKLVTWPAHARMHLWRNGTCIVEETSCLQVRLWWPIRRHSNYSITDYTCLMSGEQVLPTLERKAQPKRWLLLHFLAKLHSLRTPPPTQIVLLPPPPIVVSSTITITNSNHLEVYNIDEIKKQHACKLFVQHPNMNFKNSMLCIIIHHHFGVNCSFIFALYVCVCM